MQWLHERGFVSTFSDYYALPLWVIEDSRAYRNAEAKRDSRRAKR